jgi:polysaccharide deacetylase family protein (PEP-CTERM system associated)
VVEEDGQLMALAQPRVATGDEPTSVGTAGRHAAQRAQRHAFTIDVEDWFQAVPVAETVKSSAEHRLHLAMDTLLGVMDEAGVRGTFFWLGPAAVRHPDLLKRTAAMGHEIGCHGWSHDLVYTMTPARFRDETQRAVAVLEGATGRKVESYRAAYFSITRASLWALSTLVDLGFRFDSSVFPVKNWRYGIPDFNPLPHRVDTPTGPINEIPISVRRVLRQNIPVSGGAYFRIYPYAVTRHNMVAAERSGSGTVFYLHPWELDPDHPRVPFHWRAHATHYFNLRSTTPKLRRLLREFRFSTLSDFWHDANDRRRS